jgi:hypothetical protein
MEPAEDRGDLVPGFTPELGNRITELYRLAGGQAVAAEIVESTSETLGKWKRGRARMPFLAAVKLCETAGRSLDWLATGRGPGLDEGQAPFQGELLDEAQMRQCIETVIEGVAAFGLTRSAEEQAEMALKMYRVAQERGMKPSDAIRMFKAG